MKEPFKVFKFKRDMPDKNQVPSEFMSRVDPSSPNAKLLQLNYGKRHLTIYNNFDVKLERRQTKIKEYGLYTGCLAFGYLAFWQLIGW